MNKTIEVIFENNLLVGESPVWDEKQKQLYFVDIRGKCFYRFDYKTGSYNKTDVGQMLGCLALCENGELLLGMEDGVYRYSQETKKMTLAHEPIKIKGERFNDGKVGPDGYYYVGTAGANFSGAFYRMHNGRLEELFDKCGCSNGIDWIDNGKTMIYCDSREQKLEKFNFSLELHTLSQRKNIANISPELGSGDGLTVDAEGNVWIAVWGGSCVLHINPKSGEIMDKIELPATQVSSCCFAGEDLRDLIITTAAVRLDLGEQPMAGKIFRCRVDVGGMKFNRYKGV